MVLYILQVTGDLDKISTLQQLEPFGNLEVRMASFTFTKCDPLGTFTIFTLPSPRLLKFNVNICIEAYFFFQTELVFDAGRWVGQGEQH